MPFQIHAISGEPFQQYFLLSEAELRENCARIETATVHPGYPCVVSLADAELGERVLLVNFEHLPEHSPYRAAHAIYIREHAEQHFPGVNDVPEMLASRLLAVRGYDHEHLMVGADVVEGADLAGLIDKMFENEAVDYIHIHIARPGCFAAKATRA